MNKIPCKQVLVYTIERALATYDWLQKENETYQEMIKCGDDASDSSMKLRVLCDSFAVYVTTLFGGDDGKKYSLKSCFPHDDFSSLEKVDIVIMCNRNRNNRSGHESEDYGHFILTEDILTSNIRSILVEIMIRF
jgi:hypothetical protein